MNKKHFGAFLLAATIAVPALAADLVPWGESGAWTILKDPNRGNGCLIQSALSDGSYLRIGFDEPGKGKGYVSSFNPAWEQFSKAKKYDIAIKFGDAGFVGEGRGSELDGLPGIEVATNNIDLLIDLAKQESVNFSADGGAGLDVALTGSYDALQEALKCQAE